MDFTSRLETRSKELCNQIDEYLKLIFTGPVQSFGYVHPNFGELMQFYHISREASDVVSNCAELQIGKERNTKRTVNQPVPFEVSPRIVLFDNYFCKANDCTVWGNFLWTRYRGDGKVTIGITGLWRLSDPSDVAF